MTQKYQFAHAGKSLFIGDMPVEDIIAIGQEFSVPWYQVCDGPMVDLRVANAVAIKAAARLGVTLPDPLTVFELTEMFVVVKDDLPEMFDTPEGGIPSPLADAPATI